MFHVAQADLNYQIAKATLGFLIPLVLAPECQVTGVHYKLGLTFLPRHQVTGCSVPQTGPSHPGGLS